MGDPWYGWGHLPSTIRRFPLFLLIVHRFLRRLQNRCFMIGLDIGLFQFWAVICRIVPVLARHWLDCFSPRPVTFRRFPSWSVSFRRFPSVAAFLCAFVWVFATSDCFSSGPSLAGLFQFWPVIGWTVAVSPKICWTDSVKAVTS